MSIDSIVCARSEEVIAIKTKVLSVNCLKVSEEGGCHLDKKFKTILMSHVIKYLGKTGRRLQKNRKRRLILGSSPMSKIWERKKESPLLHVFK